MLHNKNLNVYIVDDDVEVGTILYLLLRNEGYMATKFQSGKDALRDISVMPPDLVLLDYMLPGENVENLIPQFRKKTSGELPIILMSASHDAKKASKNFPIQDFLAKPFSREEVISSIQKIVDL